MASVPSTTATDLTAASPARALRLADVAFALGVVAVPVLAHERVWVVLAITALCAVTTRDPRRAMVLAAYGAPTLVAAPWPTHCFTAVLAWWGLTRGRTDLAGRPRPVHPIRRPFPWWALPTVTLGGLACGVVVVLLDHARITGGGFVFAVPPPEPWAIVAFVAAAALLNAAGEELLWREVADSAYSTSSVVVRCAIQAATFGLGHWNGIPDGPLGACASAAYAVLLFLVWRRFGLVASLVTHMVTDAAIFATIAHHAVFAWSG